MAIRFKAGPFSVEFSPQPKPVKQPKTRKPMKRGTNKNKPSAIELEYMGWVKTFPCFVCGESGPSDAHHPICGRYGGKRNNHLSVIPLCKACHQVGPLAIHNDKAGWVMRNGPDTDYSRLYQNIAIECDTLSHGLRDALAVVLRKGD